MSLLAPRPVEERASVILPTVTCSSCSAPIALSALGEHVCAPPPPRAGPRAVPRPSQLTIPSAPSSSSATSPLSQGAPRAYQQHPPAGASRPHPRPANLNLPARPPQGQGYGSSLGPGNAISPRTPSPTNPFFPHPAAAAPPAPVNPGLGLGIGVGTTPGPGPATAPMTAHSYTADVPLSAVEPSMIDTTSGGESGMAGVGRRAFAAAAWGVRAGVALAASSKGYIQDQMHAPAPESIDTMNIPDAQPRSAGPREPVILPKVPLSGRQRSGTGPHGPSHVPMSPPQRSATALSDHQEPYPNGFEPSHRRRQSSLSDSPDVSQLHLHAAAAVPGSSSAPSSKPSFFDKYKQMVKSSSSSSSASLARQASGDAGLNEGPADVSIRVHGAGYDDVDEDEGSALPWATPLVDEPEPMLDAPHQPPPAPSSSSSSSASRAHQRYPTIGSVASSSSSASSASRSGRLGGASGSGHDTEVVVTPSASWEGLAERAAGGAVASNPSGGDMRRPDSIASDNDTRSIGSTTKLGRNDLLYDSLNRRDHLEQIEEDDDDDEEGERLVFGAPTPVKRRSGSTAMARGVNQSSSNSTIAPLAASPPKALNPYTQPSRSRTLPEPSGSTSSGSSHGHHRDGSQSNSRSHSPNARRASRTCVKCGDPVGGSRRFVERDGIVLCEADWKKMYLPACRRCSQPIEKSAVSSSDGQLKGKWHRACFTCTRCDKPFEGDDFYVHAGKPWCQYHYHEENGTLCASSSCRQPIEGSCILTAGPNSQRFHPGHLRCDHGGGGGGTCREVMDEYYDVAGGRYCERHVAEAVRRDKAKGGGGSGRAEKRRTRLVDLPRGAY